MLSGCLKKMWPDRFFLKNSEVGKEKKKSSLSSHVVTKMSRSYCVMAIGMASLFGVGSDG